MELNKLYFANPPFTTFFSSINEFHFHTLSYVFQPNQLIQLLTWGHLHAYHFKISIDSTLLLTTSTVKLRKDFISSSAFKESRLIISTSPNSTRLIKDLVSLCVVCVNNLFSEPNKTLTTN